MARNSSILLSLLIVATALADLIAAVAIFESQLANEQAISLFLALTVAQLGALCVWMMRRRDRSLVRSPLVFTFALVTALILTAAEASQSQYNNFDVEGLMTYVGLLALQTTVLIVLLWFFIPPRWIEADPSRKRRHTQFSVLHLLALMTLAAVLISILRKTESFQEYWFQFVTFCLANAFFLVGILLILQKGWPWLLRLAACVALAITLSAVCEVSSIAIADELNIWAYFLIQAIVLLFWLLIAIPPSESDQPSSQNVPIFVP